MIGPHNTITASRRGYDSIWTGPIESAGCGDYCVTGTMYLPMVWSTQDPTANFWRFDLQQLAYREYVPGVFLSDRDFRDAIVRRVRAGLGRELAELAPINLRTERVLS